MKNSVKQGLQIKKAGAVHTGAMVSVTVNSVTP